MRTFYFMYKYKYASIAFVILIFFILFSFWFVKFNNIPPILKNGLFSRGWKILEGSISVNQITTDFDGKIRDVIILNVAKEGDFSAIYVPILVSEHWFTFDFYFTKLGDGDWLTVSFNNELIQTFEGRTARNDYINMSIEISPRFKGKYGHLVIKLNGRGTEEAEVFLSNFGSDEKVLQSILDRTDEATRKIKQHRIIK